MSEVVDFLESTGLYGIGWSAPLISTFMIGKMFLKAKINSLIGSARVAGVFISPLK